MFWGIIVWYSVSTLFFFFFSSLLCPLLFRVLSASAACRISLLLADLFFSRLFCVSFSQTSFIINHIMTPFLSPNSEHTVPAPATMWPCMVTAACFSHLQTSMAALGAVLPSSAALTGSLFVDVLNDSLLLTGASCLLCLTVLACCHALCYAKVNVRSVRMLMSCHIRIFPVFNIVKIMDGSHC